MTELPDPDLESEPDYHAMCLRVEQAIHDCDLDALKKAVAALHEFGDLEFTIDGGERRKLNP